MIDIPEANFADFRNLLKPISWLKLCSHFLSGLNNASRKKLIIIPTKSLYINLTLDVIVYLQCIDCYHAQRQELNQKKTRMDDII